MILENDIQDAVLPIRTAVTWFLKDIAMPNCMLRYFIKLFFLSCTASSLTFRVIKWFRKKVPGNKKKQNRKSINRQRGSQLQSAYDSDQLKWDSGPQSLKSSPKKLYIPYQTLYLLRHTTLCRVFAQQAAKEVGKGISEGLKIKDRVSQNYDFESKKKQKWKPFFSVELLHLYTDPDCLPSNIIM